MEDTNLRIQLEEMDIEPDKIDQIVSFLSDNKKTIEANKSIGSTPNAEIMELQNKLALMGEKDWKKRTKLAAKIISLKFEE